MRVGDRGAAQCALTDAQETQDRDDRVGDHHADRQRACKLAVNADIEDIDQQAGDQEQKARDQGRNAGDFLQGVAAHGHLRGSVGSCQQDIGAKYRQGAPETSQCRVRIVGDHAAARKHRAQLRECESRAQDRDEADQ